MPAKKTKKKKEEKHPLDMTSNEAIEFLFGQEGAQMLKDYVRHLNQLTPENEEAQLKRSAKPSRKE